MSGAPQKAQESGKNLLTKSFSSTSTPQENVAGKLARTGSSSGSQGVRSPAAQHSSLKKSMSSFAAESSSSYNNTSGSNLAGKSPTKSFFRDPAESMARGAKELLKLSTFGLGKGSESKKHARRSTFHDLADVTAAVTGDANRQSSVNGGTPTPSTPTGDVATEPASPAPSLVPLEGNDTSQSFISTEKERDILDRILDEPRDFARTSAKGVGKMAKYIFDTANKLSLSISKPSEESETPEGENCDSRLAEDTPFVALESPLVLKIQQLESALNSATNPQTEEQQQVEADMRQLLELVHAAVEQASSINLLELSVDDVADQLAWLAWKSFSLVRVCELKGCAWNKPDKRSTAPTVVSDIELFNFLTQWTVTMVLTQEDLKIRAKTITWLLALDRACVERRNYAAAKAITAALGTAAVHRLRVTWGLVGGKQQRTYEELQDLLTEEGNYQKLRELLNRATRPAVPYLGMYLRDLTFLETAHMVDGALTPKGVQYWDEAISQLQHYQRVGYPIKENPVLLHFLVTTPLLSEDDAFDMSLKFEPRPIERLKEREETLSNPATQMLEPPSTGQPATGGTSRKGHRRNFSAQF
eukprot:comp13519_c1_seq1/m.9077 comp13519_c1_seq1/g.9077  ORF comp13519_c1_seq1/g.9077 comp13519_c1_seq1/m.9077 type:complete len:588 (-) comp13519_c1_seq1:167-1930(-)